jgi:hypothetical protein
MSDHTSSPEAIERDLQTTRVRLDHELTELTRRLSPGQLLDEALRYLRNNQGVDFVRRLGESVRERPIPVALSGIGLAWLMIAGPRPPERVVYRERVVGREPFRSGLGGNGGSHEAEDTLVSRAWQAGKDVARRSGESDSEYRARITEARAKVLGLTRQVQETAETFAERVQEALSAAGARVKETMQGASDQAGSYMRSWRDTASDASGRLGDAASGTYAQARDTLARGADLWDTISGNPVLLGSLGILTGAVLGALFPPSEAERTYLGGAARQARDTVAETAEGTMDRGRDVAETAAPAGAEGARKTMDAGREAVETVTQTMREGVQPERPEPERPGPGPTRQPTEKATHMGPQTIV